MLRVLVWLLVLALTVYTLVDCMQTQERQVRALPKALWALLILVLPLVGPIAWLIAGRPERPGAPRLGGPSHRDGPPRGPDDDPDFLRRL